ncbi:MAG: triose-phosphate isomerase [Actinobacteria bacterium]|uniref:triose-phosphate isomerase n=1 Tax=freshwater metagenome TaxID=449393 RepID=A0A6J6E776_9ZZZZ|nr:triose-phosphate isomerase [Actinomycetota bacterium]
MPNKRQPLMSGNWKMNLNHYEAIQIMQKLAFLVGKDDFAEVEVSVHPPFTDLRSVQTLIEGDKLGFVLGAQNCHFEDTGAFTGEVSPAFLGKLSVRYVICGHSERRQIFGETDEMVNRKVRAVFKHGMIPIMCVGETLEERESGSTIERILDQLRGGLASVAPERVSEMTIAYEPIWAIGTGKTATAEDAQEVCGAIRREVAVLFGQEVSQGVRIQYGGSVKASNISELMAQPDIDGALIGGASLDPDEFARIVQYRLH